MEYTSNPLYLERAILQCNFLFCVHKSTFSLEKLLIARVKLSRGSSFFYNYGSWQNQQRLHLRTLPTDSGEVKLCTL
jgi:hypothetical protein